MKRLSILIFISIVFGQCDTPSVRMNYNADPDIVIVNIEEGDRAFIGNLLMRIDSFKPALIAVNAMFEKEKDPAQDSILANAFRSIKNDILIYWHDANGKPIYPPSKFSDHVKEMGLVKFERSLELVNSFKPIIKEDTKTHGSFPMKIVQTWKPSFAHTIKPDRSVKIQYTRGLNQFLIIEGSAVGEQVSYEALNNKVVLLGYVGPGDEDKFITPLRFTGEEYPKGKPDTYGVVIIANAIRTILNYEKKP